MYTNSSSINRNEHNNSIYDNSSVISNTKHNCNDTSDNTNSNYISNNIESPATPAGHSRITMMVTIIIINIISITIIIMIIIIVYY